MDLPEHPVEQIVKAILYPNVFLETLAQKVGREGWPRWRFCLWSIGMATAGIAFFGLTLGLVTQVESPWKVAGVVLATYAFCWAQWAFFFSRFLTHPPGSWMAKHLVVMAVLMGDVVWEIGALLNLTFWFTERLSVLQAVQFNLSWLVLAELTMALSLVSLLRRREIEPGLPVIIWLVSVNAAGASAYQLFKPWLGL